MYKTLNLEDGIRMAEMLQTSTEHEPEGCSERWEWESAWYVGFGPFEGV